MNGEQQAARWCFKPTLFIVLTLIIFVIVWSVAAVVYTGSETPVLRRIRVFNPSKDRIKTIEIKAETAAGTQPIAEFKDILSEHVAAADADLNGFVTLGELPLQASNVNKVYVIIHMADSVLGVGVDIPEIALEAPEGTFDEICVIVDDHEDEKTWRVLVTGFYGEDDGPELRSHELLPRPTEPKLGN